MDEDTKVNRARWPQPATERSRSGRAADLLDEIDHALVEMAREGHARFAELYRRHVADALRCARRLTLRHLARDAAEEGGHEAPATIDDTIDAMTAFASLPTTWRRVLWATEVLDLSPGGTAAMLGTSPSAVAMMAMRAREAMRIAYIRQQLPASNVVTCQRALDLLATRIVVAPARTKMQFLERHLTSCLACQRAAQQIKRVFGEQSRKPTVQNA